MFLKKSQVIFRSLITKKLKTFQEKNSKKRYEQCCQISLFFFYFKVLEIPFQFPGFQNHKKLSENLKFNLRA